MWDLNLFPTYEAAVAGGTFAARSAPFSFTAADPAGLPSTFVMEGFQSFACLCPEPSAIALGIMGVAGLLLIRRRK